MSDGITTSLPGLSDEHADYLRSQAVDPDLARSLGVCSLVQRTDGQYLPEPWNGFANVPAILFPWTSPDGRVEYQVRPDNPTQDARGRPRKYMFRKDMTPVLWQLRSGPGPMLVVEGTKQALAAASYAPADVAVYGIAGCRSWQKDGVPISDLGVADGREVVVLLDADAEGNLDVYQAGTDLAQALAMEGAAKVSFGRLSAGGKSGLDDVLATRPDDKRGAYLQRILAGAKAKPADKKPTRKKRDQDIPADAQRVTLVCNQDRFNVINQLTDALVNRWDGQELFNHGGVISRRKGQVMHPLDRGAQRDIIQETAITVHENEGAQGTTYTYEWPDANSISAVMSRSDKFSRLDRIAHAPFVREDGTIVTTPGYDEATHTFLVPDAELEGIKIPDDPSPEQIEAARNLIMDEWLGDFPFEGDADRANALGMVLTPAIRGLVSIAPMAVIDGVQMGVGKNKIADTLLLVYTGQAARPMNFVDEKEELRKQITSAFRTGQEFFVFDEAHTIEGSALAQALTASTWQDRILGVSTMAEFPNRVTWMALGNNVQVRGDITRRVYRIRVAPKYANPQDRPDHLFRHPGVSGLRLEEWVAANRFELMTAILTLVRAWFAAGCPRPTGGVSMGSFEAWQKIVGGIVQVAGLPGFLDNLTVWRSESDFDSQYWINHFNWLVEQFSDQPFRTADVRAKALGDPAGYMAPPRLDDPADKGYSKALGEAYARLRGRRYEGLHVERMGTVKGHVSLWTVQDDGRGMGGAGGTVPTQLSEEKTSPDGAHPPVHPGTHARAREEMFGGAERGQRSPSVPPFPSPPDKDTGEYGGGHERRLGDDTDADGGDAGREDGAGGPARDLFGEGAVRPVRPGGHGGEQDAGAPHGVRPDDEQGGVLAQEGEQGRQADQLLGHPIAMPGTLIGTVQYQVDEGNRAAVEMLHGTPLPRTVELVTFDLETGDSGDLHRHGPGYVRLPGWALDDGPVNLAAYQSDLVVDALLGAETITGHNIMAFDLPALVREGRKLTMEQVHELARDGRLFDGLLAARHLDPPMAKEKGVDATRKYDLDSLGVKFGLGEKSTAAKQLAKKYGGWGSIPVEAGSVDGDAFRAYCTQDVQLSRALYHRLLGDLGGSVPPYLAREHRVAAIAAQISFNGFRVDVPELARWVDKINARKAAALELLHARYGIPLTDAKGRKQPSPLSTKIGKAALTKAFTDAGATSIWTTEKTGEIQVGADHMRHLGSEYHHLPGVVEIAKAVYRVVSSRTVYETVQNHLVGDRVHPKIGFDQATGRWSVTSPGLTVLGKRGGRHVERMVFLPDPGDVMLAVDLSQVDMRAVAGLSGDAAYIDMLRHEDPHAEIAKALFGDVGRREDAKRIGHGWNYGRGIKAISMSEEIDPALVRKFDSSMYERFGRLVQWRDEVRELAASGALLDNGFGRPMRPDPQRAHTQGPALKGQGAARDIMMDGMLNLPAPVLPMLRAQIHDEVILSVPADQVEDVRRAVVDAFTFEWRGVPIMADSSPAARTWGHCYTVK